VESVTVRDEPRSVFKIHGILRDALRAKSVGVIEHDPDKGLIKYAKPPV
jgi:hypothetical protein